MNKIIVKGNIGQDAKSFAVGSSEKVGFSIAETRRYKVNGEQRSETNWFNVSLWGKRGSALLPYLTKGKSLLVIGRISIREDKENPKIKYYDINADEVEFLDRNTEGGGQRPTQAASEDGFDFGDVGSDDDLPF